RARELPTAHGGPRHRRRRRCLLRRGHRVACQLQARARRGCLGWAHPPEVPVGRNGLRWPYLAAGRRTVARAALQGRNRDPDPVRSASALRSWALALKKRLGFKRAAVALARSVLQTHTERSSI